MFVRGFVTYSWALAGSFLLVAIARQLHLLQHLGVALDTLQPVLEPFTTAPHVQPDDRIHDEASLTTLFWNGGKPIIDKESRARPHTQFDTASQDKQVNFTIDAVTIGQLKAKDSIRVQSETWGISIRFFFGSTENDDTDQNCSTALASFDDVKQLSKICRRNTGFGPELKDLRHLFAHTVWVGTRANPAGWMCAQQRFAATLGKVGKFYQRELLNAFKIGGGRPVLPDYLLIQDDDTFFNINLLHRDIFSKINASTAYFGAGCLIHVPLHMANLTFPFGGFGTILSRGALLRMIQPIYCNGTFLNASERMKPLWDVDIAEEFLEHACMRLKKNALGEKSSFQNGMSVSDLMLAHVAANPFRDYPSWDKQMRPGYCLHGDWVLGYFFNYYLFGSNRRTVDSLPYFNADPSLGYIYGGRKGVRNCVHDDAFCPPTAHACHKVNATMMASLFHDKKMKY